MNRASARAAAPAPVCPCRAADDPAPYAQCCGRYHAGAEEGRAPDAERLMRSRYSAYALGLTPYLLSTWHPSTRPALIEPKPTGWHWLGLQVRAHTPIDADHATVEFVARSKCAGRAQRLHEISRFVREGGRWYYVDAQ